MRTAKTITTKDTKTLFDDEVNAVGAGETDSVVDDWQADLVFKMQSGSTKFVMKASIAGALEQSGAERAVDFIAAPITAWLVSFGPKRMFLCVLRVLCGERL